MQFAVRFFVWRMHMSLSTLQNLQLPAMQVREKMFIKEGDIGPAPDNFKFTDVVLPQVHSFVMSCSFPWWFFFLRFFFLFSCIEHCHINSRECRSNRILFWSAFPIPTLVDVGDMKIICSYAWRTFLASLAPANLRDSKIVYSSARKHWRAFNVHLCNFQVWERLKKNAKVEDKQREIEEFNKNNRWRKRGFCMNPLKYGLTWSWAKSTSIVNIAAADGSGACFLGYPEWVTRLLFS